MKRLFSIFTIVVALIYGAIMFSVTSREQAAAPTSSRVNQDQCASNTHRSFVLNAETLLTSGQESTLVNHSYNLQEGSLRICSYSTNACRLRNFKQLVCQQYLSRKNVCQFRLAFKQLNGYYLYHLRKLLI